MFIAKTPFHRKPKPNHLASARELGTVYGEARGPRAWKCAITMSAAMPCWQRRSGVAWRAAARVHRRRCRQQPAASRCQAPCVGRVSCRGRREAPGGMKRVGPLLKTATTRRWVGYDRHSREEVGDPPVPWYRTDGVMLRWRACRFLERGVAQERP